MYHEVFKTALFDPILFLLKLWDMILKWCKTLRHDNSICVRINDVTNILPREKKNPKYYLGCSVSLFLTDFDRRYSMSLAKYFMLE